MNSRPSLTCRTTAPDTIPEEESASSFPTTCTLAEPVLAPGTAKQDTQLARHQAGGATLSQLVLTTATAVLCIAPTGRISDRHRDNLACQYESGSRRRPEHRWIVPIPWLTCRRSHRSSTTSSSIEKEEDGWKRGRWWRRRRMHTKGRREGRRHRPRRIRLAGPRMMTRMIVRRVVYVLMSAGRRTQVGAKRCGICVEKG